MAAMTSTRRAWAVWSTGVLAYVVAVLNRTSFGVAGVEASERFGASASQLATFVVLQLLVYAALQIPVGLLLDRFGSRRLIVTGAVLMAAGQLVLALSTSVGLAVTGRVLVGAGDAMTFLSVLRMVPAWFPARRVPVVTQLTAIVGQLGQVLSAVPLVALIGGPGWTPAFAGVAATGLVVAALAATVLADSPDARVLASEGIGMRQAWRDLVTVWRHPGTRLGLWSHFATQFSGTVFALLWGYPFLVSGEGVDRTTASALLTVFVLTGMATGPYLGVLVHRHPLRRSWLVLAIVAASASAWTVVLAWPGPAPLWLLTALVLVLAAGGPGSMIGFDFARSFNPPNRLGTATGLVNVGGFTASLLTILAVGVILDVRGGGTAGGYTLDDFRAALSVQLLFWLVGVVGIVRTRADVRRRMAEHGVVVPPLREALRRRRAARRSPGP
jgi:MFS family permease